MILPRSQHLFSSRSQGAKNTIKPDTKGLILSII